MQRVVVAVVVALSGWASGAEVAVSTFQAEGMGVDWCARTGWIAYDRQGPGGCYHVRLCRPDGSQDQPLSDRTPGLPGRTVGSPAWSPDGAFLLVVVEKARHPGLPIDATPGFGGYSDLWAIAADGSWSQPLTDTPNDADHGTIGGHIAPDGRTVLWTERIRAPAPFTPRGTFGCWQVCLADLEMHHGRPRLARRRTVAPGKAGFNEGSSFAPDSQSILFCSCWNQPSVWSSQIFRCDLDGGHLTQLTHIGYNEHAVWRPDGRAIVWMSTCRATLGGTDWWMMDADGTHPRRLTAFNEPHAPISSGQPQWTGLVTFSPDGGTMLGGVGRNLLTMHSWIARVVLPP